MPEKTNKGPYNISYGNNGRGTKALNAPNAANMGRIALKTRGRRGANANLHLPIRNYIAINMSRKASPPSIRHLANTLKRRQGSKIPEHTILRVRGSTPSPPEPIEVVINRPGSPNTRVLVNRPSSRPRTPNNTIKVVSHRGRSPHTRIKVRNGRK